MRVNKIFRMRRGMHAAFAFDLSVNTCSWHGWGSTSRYVVSRGLSSDAVCTARSLRHRNNSSRASASIVRGAA